MQVHNAITAPSTVPLPLLSALPSTAIGQRGEVKLPRGRKAYRSFAVSGARLWTNPKAPSSPFLFLPWRSPLLLPSLPPPPPLPTTPHRHHHQTSGSRLLLRKGRRGKPFLSSCWRREGEEGWGAARSRSSGSRTPPTARWPSPSAATGSSRRRGRSACSATPRSASSSSPAPASFTTTAPPRHRACRYLLPV